MTTHDVLEVLRDGYADTFSEQDDDGACYNFLQPEWITDPEIAQQSAHLIGDHGDFIADRVAATVAEIFGIDPQAAVVFGRENWPVLYVATSEVEPVMQSLEDAYPTNHTVLHEDDPIGWYKDDGELHGGCPHETAPILAAEWPEKDAFWPSDSVQFIRALWQDG